MFKKVQPKKEPFNLIGQFPHCDSRVLHAPGECKTCDNHQVWQELRLAWGICFTGYTPEENELPCPSEVRRKLDTINRWPGNRSNEASAKSSESLGKIVDERITRAPISDDGK